MILPNELNDEMRGILGRTCINIAWLGHLLRDAKIYEVKRKVEDEQAVAIHWMLTLYAIHGEKWMDEANKKIKEMREHVRLQEKEKAAGEINAAS